MTQMKNMKGYDLIEWNLYALKSEASPAFLLPRTNYFCDLGQQLALLKKLVSLLL